MGDSWLVMPSSVLFGWGKAGITLAWGVSAVRGVSEISGVTEFLQAVSIEREKRARIT